MLKAAANGACAGKAAAAAVAASGSASGSVALAAGGVGRMWAPAVVLWGGVIGLKSTDGWQAPDGGETDAVFAFGVDVAAGRELAAIGGGETGGWNEKSGDLLGKCSAMARAYDDG